MSSSLDVTWTLCAVAVSGLAEGEGDGAGVDVDPVVEVEAAVVETASWAIAMFVIMNSAPAKIGNFFIKCFRFQSLFVGCGVAP